MCRAFRAEVCSVNTQLGLDTIKNYFCIVAFWLYASHPWIYFFFNLDTHFFPWINSVALVRQENGTNPSVKGRSTPLLQVRPSNLINCRSILRARCLRTTLPKGEGRERRWAHPARTEGWLLHLAPFHPLPQSPQGKALLTKRGSANTTRDKHGRTHAAFGICLSLKITSPGWLGKQPTCSLKIGFISSLSAICLCWVML